MQPHIAVLPIGAALLLSLPAYAEGGDGGRSSRAGVSAERGAERGGGGRSGWRTSPREGAQAPRRVEADGPGGAQRVAAPAPAQPPATPAPAAERRARAAEARGEPARRLFNPRANERDMLRSAAAARAQAARHASDPVERPDFGFNEENALAARRNGREGQQRARDDREGGGYYSRWDRRTLGNDGRGRSDYDRDRHDKDRDRDDKDRYRADWHRDWYDRGWSPYWASGRYDRYGHPYSLSNRYKRYVWRFSYDPRFYYGAPWVWDPYWTIDPYWWRPYGFYDWNRYGFQWGYGVLATDLVRSDPIIARWALVNFDRDGNGYLGPGETQDAARLLRRYADVNGDLRLNDREYRIAVQSLREFAYSPW